jgi:hypothetical protein
MPWTAAAGGARNTINYKRRRMTYLEFWCNLAAPLSGH